MSTQATSPKPLPTIDTEAIRRKLAGLADPLKRGAGETEQVEIKELASRLCSILASLFGDSLDRMTLWDRIGSAFATALAKTSDDDCDRFVSLCLEHVKADAAKAAACPALGSTLETFTIRPPEWRFAFLQYIDTHSYAVLVHGRARWELVKKKEVEL